jgi:hypothetical protein
MLEQLWASCTNEPLPLALPYILNNAGSHKDDEKVVIGEPVLGGAPAGDVASIGGPAGAGGAGSVGRGGGGGDAAALSHLANARRVLTGGFTSELSLSFLYKNSNADARIMSNLKRALEERATSRNSVLHNCAVTAHGYLNAGTTNDYFLRDNLDWMKKASNW